MSYKPEFYPTWLYHISAEPRIFYSQEELGAAGDGWVDSPDRVYNPSAPEPVIDLGHDTPETKTDVDVSVKPKTNNELREFIVTNFDVVPKGRNKKELLAEINDLEFPKEDGETGV